MPPKNKMLVKKEKKITKYFKYLLLVVFFGVAVFYRTFFINLFFKSLSYLKVDSQNVELSSSEREEFESLKIENKILQDENSKILEEFSIVDTEDTKYPVFMLLGESSLYGTFYVTLPKDRTPYKGMNIFANGNIVVGQVEEILPSALKIAKLGQNSSFIANSLENEESIELQSLGSGLYFGTVSGGSNISLGDSIVMKGYPKAIVGTVVEIEKGDTSLSNIFVRTPYNTNNKEIFYVIQ